MEEVEEGGEVKEEEQGGSCIPCCLTLPPIPEKGLRFEDISLYLIIHSLTFLRYQQPVFVIYPVYFHQQEARQSPKVVQQIFKR